jgi:O-antigen ligase
VSAFKRTAPQYLLLVTLAGITIGAIAVGLGNWSSSGSSRVLLLPISIVALLLLTINKELCLLLLILTRAPIDPLLETIKLGPVGGGAILNALVILIAAACLAEQTKDNRWSSFAVWSPILIVMIISAARAAEPLYGVRSFLSFLTNFAVFLAPSFLPRCRYNLHYSIKAIVLSSSIPVTYAFFDLYHGGYANPEAERISSTFPHPNIFAFYLVLVISLAFFILKTSSRSLTGGSRIFLWAYLFVMVIELALTKTRSAWAVLFLTLIVYGCLFEKKYLLYSLVLTVTAMLITPIQDRLLNLTDAKVFWNYGFAANSYEWRQILWESAWNWMSPSNMVFGYGPGSFLKFSPTFFPLSGGTEFGAHNVYLQLLFEEGLIGVASFAWLFAGLLLVIYRDTITEKLAIFIVLALLVQYLVAGYSDNMLDYLSFNWNFWFLCGTAYSIACINHSLEATKSISKKHTRFRIKLQGG